MAAFDGKTNLEYTFLYPNPTGNQLKSIKDTIPNIRFLGLFDTVASIGSTTTRYDPDDPDAKYPNPNVYARMSLKIPNIVYACSHAVAINEYRKAYEYTTIRQPGVVVALNYVEQILLELIVTLAGMQMVSGKKLLYLGLFITECFRSYQI